MSKWYDIKAKANESAEISIYDEIGRYGVSASTFNYDLKAIGKKCDLTVHINSPGGSVFDGMAIYNILKNHQGNVDVVVDGIAASMASIIAMAGNSITIPENAFLMIHNPMSGLAYGESKDLRKHADFLDQIAASMAEIYAERSGKSIEDVKAIMDAETWMTGPQAVSEGFADATSDAVALSAKYDLKQYASIPQSVSSAFTHMTATQRVIAELNAFKDNLLTLTF